MTIADELRKYADRALKEDGIYFSGAYLDRLARRAMSEQAENATLRQQLADATESMERVEERCAKLREQNDKLRLLATAMQVYGSMDTDVDLLRALEIRDAIKRLSDELGVEVTS